jgi:hypothetical protein
VHPHQTFCTSEEIEILTAKQTEITSDALEGKDKGLKIAFVACTVFALVSSAKSSLCRLYDMAWVHIDICNRTSEVAVIFKRPVKIS